jgi:HEAT repeat protein
MMRPTVAGLVAIRSRLAEEVLSYLNELASAAASLPFYYPGCLRSIASDETGFDRIRQMVQVVENREELRRVAAELERVRSAGYWDERIAYGPRSRRPTPVSDWQDKERADQDVPPALAPFNWDEQAGARFQRLVILGNPGSGKSWLLRWEARRLAREAASEIEERRSSLTSIVLPILIRLPNLAIKVLLEEALPDLALRGSSSEFQELLRKKLGNGSCVLLLDAWDEVPHEIQKDLRHTLEDFARAFPLSRLLLTSRIVGYGSCPVPGAQEAELVAWDEAQVESFVNVWFSPEEANEFLTHLGSRPQVRGLARIPLMLTLMCKSCEQKHPLFPARRAPLYDRCLRGLLGEWKREEAGQEPVTSAFVDALVEVLRVVGRALFVEGYEQFSVSTLRDKLLPVLQERKPGHDLYGWTPTALILLLLRDGVLIRAGDHPESKLLFLHRTFHEYLAAAALADEVHLGGWKNIAGLVERNAWLPEWREVILLLAGSLAEPTPLLQMLRSRRKDDLFRHRLGLAMMCLGELPEQTQSRCRREINQITRAGWRVYVRHHWADTLNLIGDIVRGLPGLIAANGEVKPGVKLLDYLGDALTERGSDGVLHGWLDKYLSRDLSAPFAVAIVGWLIEWDILPRGLWRWKLGAVAVGGLGVAATPELVSQLAEKEAEWIFSKDLRFVDTFRYDVIRDVVESQLKRLGAAEGVMPTVALRLADMLKDPDSKRRHKGLSGLEYLGAAAATTEVVFRLVELLSSPLEPERTAAADAIGRMGAGAAKPEVLENLAKLLWPALWVEQRAAAIAIGRMGVTAAKPTVLARLAESLRHSADRESQRHPAERLLDPSQVGYEACVTLGRMGPLAATPEVLMRLAEVIRGHPNRGVRCYAAMALGQVGPTLELPNVLEVLVRFLQDANDNVEMAAAQALMQLAASTATSEMVSNLMELTKYEDDSVRGQAAAALGHMGAVSATPTVVSRLSDLLLDRSAWVRRKAASGLANIGAVAATSEVVARLTDLMRKEGDKFARGEIAVALGNISAVLEDEDALLLLELLCDQWRVWPCRARKALWRMGNIGAKLEVLNKAWKLLCWPQLHYSDVSRVDYRDRDWASGVLETVMDGGFRIFRYPFRRIRTAHVRELAR